MEERKINLEEILNSHLKFSSALPIVGINKHFVILAMKEACRQTLELAAENAGAWCYAEGNEPEYGVDKQSILNTIKQIE